LSSLPWCIDRVGDIESSKTTVPFAASKMASNETATLAAVVPISHAKPPPNQVLASVNQIAQLWEEVSIPSNEALFKPNDTSTSQNEALLAGNVVYSQVRETAINNKKQKTLIYCAVTEGNCSYPEDPHMLFIEWC